MPIVLQAGAGLTETHVLQSRVGLGQGGEWVLSILQVGGLNSGSWRFCRQAGCTVSRSY